MEEKTKLTRIISGEQFTVNINGSGEPVKCRLVADKLAIVTGKRRLADVINISEDVINIVTDAFGQLIPLSIKISDINLIDK